MSRIRERVLQEANKIVRKFALNVSLQGVHLLVQFSVLFETRPKATGFQDGKVLVVSPVGEVSTAGLWFLINHRRPPQGVNYPCLHNRKHLQPTSCGPEHSTSNIHCFYQLAHFGPKIFITFSVIYLAAIFYGSLQFCMTMVRWHGL